MKYIILSLLAASLSFQLAAQVTQQKNDSVFQLVVKYLNEREAAKIYPLLNEDFQKARPLDMFIAEDKQIYAFGKMQAQFEAYKNGRNRYKAKFPDDSLSYTIGLDSSGKIASMFFLPYPDGLQRVKNDSVFQLVVNYLNAQEGDKVFSMLNEGFQKMVPLDKFTATNQKILYPRGKMQVKFEAYENGLNRYKALFSRDSLSYSIGVDPSGKIASMFFGPYFDKFKKRDQVLTNNPISTLLDKLVDSAARPYASLEVNCGLSIGILKDGKTYFYNYGETRRGNKQLPDEHTLFEIGSITKTFTATLLADAVNSGKIRLDDPVSKYLPDSVPPIQFEGVPATIRMLSNHTSGIPRDPSNMAATITNPADPSSNYDINHLYSFYKMLKLKRRPGTRFEYSNVGVATLAVILENLYQKGFEELVTEKILKPLNMTETMQFIHGKDSARVAAGYGYRGSYTGPLNDKALAGAGALRSTAADILRYAQANIACKSRALNKAIQLTHTPTWEMPKIGLGWFLEDHPAFLDEYLTHGGTTYGYRSDLIIVPKKQLAVIVLSNSNTNVLSEDQIARDIIKGIITGNL
ncbi:MAG: serine hydrolase [Williamsia sp.]|nr:serine hydrolase [Williamsia sp.]